MAESVPNGLLCRPVHGKAVEEKRLALAQFTIARGFPPKHSFGDGTNRDLKRAADVVSDVQTSWRALLDTCQFIETRKSLDGRVSNRRLSGFVRNSRSDAC
jgi:hypothetical protein